MEAQTRAAIEQQVVVPVHHGGVHVARAEAVQFQIEVRRNHADDCEFFSVEREVLANDVRGAAKFAFPEACADHGDGRRADLIVAAEESASHHGLHAQESKRNPK